MFTIDQIKEAHSNVKSGADFPKYIQDIIQLGVIGYETRVEDGNTIYFGANNYKIESGSKYKPLSISEKGNKEQFQKDLKQTQQGKTNYPEFCLHAAKSGIQKWVVDMSAMTCTYFDRSGNSILVENIPVPLAHIES
jgi:uncharacterized protein YbcV (DUF1398 family)